MTAVRPDGARPATTCVVAALAGAGLAALLTTGCRGVAPAARTPWDDVDDRLRPEAIAAGLRRAEGGRYRATTRFFVGWSGAGGAAPDHAITTTTELAVDRDGAFTLHESNDQGGRRQIAVRGGVIAVAIDDGRATTRPARSPEPERLLAEALGGPEAAWQVVRRQAEATAKGEDVTLSLRATARRLAHEIRGPLQTWRDTIQLTTLSGQIAWAAETPNLFRDLAIKATFTAARDGQPIAGEVEVIARFDDLGASPKVILPDAGPLPPRQRTTLEERALLSGLPGPAGAAGPAARREP